jgi:hypothetical protein
MNGQNGFFTLSISALVMASICHSQRVPQELGKAHPEKYTK